MRLREFNDNLIGEYALHCLLTIPLKMEQLQAGSNYISASNNITFPVNTTGVCSLYSKEGQRVEGLTHFVFQPQNITIQTIDDGIAGGSLTFNVTFDVVPPVTITISDTNPGNSLQFLIYLCTNYFFFFKVPVMTTIVESSSISEGSWVNITATISGYDNLAEREAKYTKFHAAN